LALIWRFAVPKHIMLTLGFEGEQAIDKQLVDAIA
jgi:hypothetical protein